MGDADDMVHIGKGPFEEFVGEDGGSISKPKERVVGEDGTKAHGTSMKDGLVA